MQPFFIYTRAVMVWNTPPNSIASKPASFVFTDEHWEAFAAALLEEKDTFQAALRVFNNQEDLGRACWINANWVHDTRIKAIQERLLKENGIEAYLPTKHKAVRKLWEFAEDSTVKHSDRIKAVQLMAELSGWILKPEDKNDDKTPEMPPAINFGVGADHDKPATD